MIVADAMKKIVISSTPSTPLKELWHTCFVKKINSVPIVDSKNFLVGIVCKDDILSHLYSNYEEFTSDFDTASDFDEMEKKVRTIGSLKAKDVMKTSVIFTRVNTHIMRALSRMIVRHVDQLPVVSDDNRLIGIITKGDIFNLLFQKRMKRK